MNLDASPKPGDIVLAVHDSETMLKILEQRDESLWLVALRDRPARKVDEDTRILGVVRMCIGRP